MIFLHRGGAFWIEGEYRGWSYDVQHRSSSDPSSWFLTIHTHDEVIEVNEMRLTTALASLTSSLMLRDVVYMYIVIHVHHVLSAHYLYSI